MRTDPGHDQNDRVGNIAAMQIQKVGRALAKSLLKLRRTSRYNRESDWVLASPIKKGKQPRWPDTLWLRYGKPAVKAAEIRKRVAFHTFRHTYTTLLTQNSEDLR